MTHPTSSSRFGARGRASRLSGFTLLQILMVTGLIALLAAVLVGQFGRGRESVARVQCDVHLKSIVLAIDTFRQENNRLPLSLRELQTKGYLTLDMLRCPSDPELGIKGSAPDYTSYKDGYILRDARDSGELPVVVCPWHEKAGEHGAQGFKGGYTHTFAARPAILGSISGSVTVTRPGQGVLAIPASGQLPVRGGDRIKVGAGTALLSFADGSQASLGNNSEMSVLQSYMAGQTSDSLYTLVRQFAGSISYSVVSGNKFDVATPTATAGALGTKFTIQIVEPLATTNRVNPNPMMQPPQEALLTVSVHAVAFTCHGRTVTVSQGEPGVRSDDPALAAKPHTPRDSPAKSFSQSSGGNGSTGNGNSGNGNSGNGNGNGSGSGNGNGNGSGNGNGNGNGNSGNGNGNSGDGNTGKGKDDSKSD